MAHKAAIVLSQHTRELRKVLILDYKLKFECFQQAFTSGDDLRDKSRLFYVIHWNKINIELIFMRTWFGFGYL